MEIGDPIRTVRVEPATSPIPRRLPIPERAPQTLPTPARRIPRKDPVETPVPERTPIKR